MARIQEFVVRLAVFVWAVTSLLAMDQCPARGPSDGEPNPPEKTEMNGNWRITQARLEIVPERHGNGDSLILTLRNVGDTPIAVDRNLVFGITIDVSSVQGVRIPLCAVRSSGEVAPDAKNRCLSLKPGDAISRRIDLREGWKVLRGGTGRAELPDGQPLVTGYEEMVRISKDARPKKVTVNYGGTAGFWEAFLGYTGMTVKEANLFEGPLAQTIEFAGGVESGVGSTPDT